MEILDLGKDFSSLTNHRRKERKYSCINGSLLIIIGFNDRIKLFAMSIIICGYASVHIMVHVKESRRKVQHSK